MLIGVKLIVGSCFEIIDQFVDFDLLLIHWQDVQNLSLVHLEITNTRLLIIPSLSKPFKY